MKEPAADLQSARAFLVPYPISIELAKPFRDFVAEICHTNVVSFANMSSSIPPVLASYVQQCIDDRSLTALTSILDTPTNWLLTRFLVSALQKSNHGNSAAAAQSNGPAANNYKVIFVSVFRSFDTWSELARKCVSRLMAGPDLTCL